MTGLLRAATIGLPARWREWGAALRAEAAAIPAGPERRAFVRSGALAAFLRGAGPVLGLALAACIVVAVTAVAVSRIQLAAGGPGLLSVTVPLPGILLFATALILGVLSGSPGYALRGGLVAFVALAVTVFAVLGTEGQLWMAELGVFVLDADPPRVPASPLTVVLDVFSTGMWVGHVTVWIAFLLLGSIVGGLVGRARIGVYSVKPHALRANS